MAVDNTLKSEYEKLPDGILLALFHDSHGLTASAKEALVQCLKQRQLAGFTTDSESAEMYPGDDDQINSEKVSLEMLQWKLDGFNNDMIIARLTHQGYSTGQIVRLAGQLKNIILEKSEDADAARLGALIRLVCGIAVFLIAWLARLGNGVYFIALVLVVISTIQAAIADSRKSRFQYLLTDNQFNSNEEDEPA